MPDQSSTVPPTPPREPTLDQLQPDQSALDQSQLSQPQPDRPRPDEPAPDEASSGWRHERFDCADPEQRATGLRVALASLARGELVVIPTDTVYGLAVDAFSPRGVPALLAAKGRGRDMPVPVLVGTVATFRALVLEPSPAGEQLVEEFWPGPLTLVCVQQPSLRWDLGDALGTVAVRMPDQALALELLARHGPLAVSSANRSGHPAATTCDDAVDQLGDAVTVYLDSGPSRATGASTIVDLTGRQPRVLREGVLSAERLRQVLPNLAGVDLPPP